MIKLIYGPSESKLPKMLKLRWISWKMGHGKWYVLASTKPLEAVIICPPYAALVAMAA